MPEHDVFEPFKMPNNCSLNDLFSSYGKTNLSLLLSPHEYVILYLTKYFHSKKNFSHINVTDLIIMSIKKMRIYPILTLKAYASEEFRNAVINPEISSIISESSIPFVVEHVLDIYSSLLCNGSESPLHKVVQNDRNRQWMFALYSFLDQLFVKFSSIHLDNCYDKDGYNLLHRSVIGGQQKTVKYLLENGMNVLQKSKTNQSTLTLSILSAPYTRNGSVPPYYTNRSKFHSYQLVNQTAAVDNHFDHNGTVNFDEIASSILMNLENLKFNRSEFYLEICSDHDNDLGLIHIASAKGMLSFLETSKELFGDEILNCRNKHGVTPMYFADMYRQTNIVQWLEKNYLTFHRPDQACEIMLIYNLIENYELPFSYDWRCFINFGVGFNALRRNQIFKCTGKYLRLPIEFQNPIKSDVYKILHQEMSASFHEKDWQRSKYENHYWFLLNYYLKKKTHNHVYYLYRLLLLFGSDDRRYIFHLLFLRRTSVKANHFDPISDLTVKTLVNSILSKKYEYLRKLKMERDLHKSWLSYEIHTDHRDDFQYVLFNFYEAGLFSTVRQQNYEVNGAEIVIRNKADRNCYYCRHSSAKHVLISWIKQLSKIKTNEQLNRKAMKCIPECNHVPRLSMKKVIYRITNDLKFIADLNSLDKKEFKALVIELEIRIKRIVKMIDSLPETENAIIQPYELFYCSSVFHGNILNINDVEMYNMIKCTKLYAKNEHLKVFRKLLITVLQTVEREFEYDYHI